MKKLMIWLALPAMICALFMMAEAEPMIWDENTGINEVIAYSGFGDWGRLIFPVDEDYYSGSTLKDLRLTWYSNIRPAKTMEIVNYFKEMVDVGETVFYDIYTDAEKAADPWKADTGHRRSGRVWRIAAQAATGERCRQGHPRRIGRQAQGGQQLGKIQQQGRL